MLRRATRICCPIRQRRRHADVDIDNGAMLAAARGDTVTYAALILMRIRLYVATTSQGASDYFYIVVTTLIAPYAMRIQRHGATLDACTRLLM